MWTEKKIAMANKTDFVLRLISKCVILSESVEK
jgi:hypothetical protein